MKNSKITLKIPFENIRRHFVKHFVHFCKWPQNGISEDPYIHILTKFVYGGSQNT